LRVAATHIGHLQTFQGLLEAVKIAFGSGSSEGGGKEVTTNAAAISALSSLGRG
jgi:hypothetical protein